MKALFSSLILFSFCFLSVVGFSHDDHSSHIGTRTWLINNKQTPASFLMIKNDVVYLELDHEETVSLSINSLAAADKKYVLKKKAEILKLNTRTHTDQTSEDANLNALIVSLLLLAMTIFGTYKIVKNKKMKFVIYLFLGGSISILFGFKNKLSTTDPTEVDLAFIPFKPTINTNWDNDYFYIESKGIPTTHGMMTGIASNGWQQQVPIPQCYIGANHWSIPLNPVFAASPVPVNSAHFTKGAIAVAVNGIPIFNPYTNTGADAYLTGQLDTWGGHCGRADDYHYHTAPLHLYGTTSNTLPIAYALDGYAVYGAYEPSGVSMTTLDANHGHVYNNTYHYHGSAGAPYMIGQMVGQVSEDANLQINPQAASQPIRPATTPLSGALITSCTDNANANGYDLSYTLNGSLYQVNYNWNTSGVYTYNFVNPSSSSTSVYNGFVQCIVTSTASLPHDISNQLVHIHSNPATDFFTIDLGEKLSPKDISLVSLFNATGKLVYSSKLFKETIAVSGFPKGVYHLILKTSKGTISKKVIVQ